ncbi:MAG TPA: DUF5668 domain-containing protein [Anaerolineae bacterium]|nr:DUF5668 domain-containing protein [Anaerolineae bacterium]
MNHAYRRPSLFWPIVLIGVGIIFLLNNAGLIRGNPWAIIWQFWPVLLIVIGLDILFGRRSAVGSVISAVLALALVGFVIWLLVAGPTLNIPGINFGGDLQERHVEHPLGETRTADIDIGFSTGENRLYALSDSQNLIEGDLRYYGGLTWNVSGSGDRVRVRLDHSSVNLGVFQSPENWEIGLNPRATYNLDLSLGVGRATLDLSELTLGDSQLDADVGAGDVQLPDSGKFRLRINGGVGTLRISAPREIALRAEVDTGIGTFNAGSRLRQISDRMYETEGFESAENAITLDIDMGIGTVTIVDE